MLVRHNYMKAFLAISVFFFFGLTYAQTNDTLVLFNRSKQIINLFINENADELLKVYENSEGPKYITKDQIIRLIKIFETKKINTAYISIDSVTITCNFKIIPKDETREAINSKEYIFEFKYPSTNIKYKLDNFKIIIAFSKWWYEKKKEPKTFELYYIDFAEKNKEA